LVVPPPVLVEPPPVLVEPPPVVVVPPPVFIPPLGQDAFALFAEPAPWHPEQDKAGLGTGLHKSLYALALNGNKISSAANGVTIDTMYLLRRAKTLFLNISIPR
jgi:hypothetical protein